MTTTILLEGLDGCGKSTLAAALRQYMKNWGKRVALVQSPGHTEGAKAIRQFVKYAGVALTPTAQFLLFMAAGADAMPGIRALFDGPDAVDYVVMDRWAPSSVAYQGAQGVSLSDIEMVYELFCKLPIDPALSFYLDVPPEVRAKRREDRNAPESKVDRYESKGPDYMVKVEAIYQRMVQAGQLRVLDGTKDVDTLVGEIMRAVAETEARTRTMFG